MLLWPSGLLTLWGVHDLVWIKLYLRKNCWILPTEINFLKQKVAVNELTNLFSEISHHLAYKDWKMTFHSKIIFSSLWIQCHLHCLISLFEPTPTYIKGFYMKLNYYMLPSKWGILGGTLEMKSFLAGLNLLRPTRATAGQFKSKWSGKLFILLSYLGIFSVQLCILLQ